MHFPQPGATLPNGIFEFMARDKLDFLSKIVFSPVSLWVKITSKVPNYQMSDNFMVFEITKNVENETFGLIFKHYELYYLRVYMLEFCLFIDNLY